MIKFFRKIRKNLLTEGKTSKYFKYAIGEIILVVIGILIALQINTWNEIRKDKTAETGILTKLLEDLQSAERFSNEYIESEQNYLNIIELVLNKDTLGVVLEDEIKTSEYFNKAFWDFEIKVPVINTYSDLKNAGKIAIISNNEIRDRLSVLDANTINLDRLILDRMNVHQMRIDEICVEDINFLQLLKFRLPNYNISPGPKNDYMDIMSRPKVRNLMGIKSILTYETLGYRKNVHKEMETIIQLIRSELGDKISFSENAAKTN